MATYYGSWKTESTTGAKARLYLVTSVVQNQALNYSTITVKTYIQVANNRTYQEGSFMGATTNTNINSIHAYGSTSDSFGINSSKLLSTRSVDIIHNDDGTRGCYLQASGTINVVNDYGDYETMTLSLAGRTETLQTINRTSSISNNSGSGVDFGTTITFSITRPSTETHTLSYVVNGTTYTIGTGIGTSCTYTFPTSLINSFPSNASPLIWVSCVSSNGTSCGTTVYLKVPSNYVPSCSLAISDAGDVPSSWGIWLKSKSKISGTITAEGIAGSWISSYYCSANGSSYSNSSFTTDYLKNSGGQTITASVSDSRGRVKSVNQILVVTDYWTPTLSSFSVVRCNADGVEENEGTYGKVKCNFSIAPCNDNNTKSLIVKYGDVSKTFTLNSYSGSVKATTSELFEGLSTASNHAFEFYLIDYFNPNGIKFSFTMTPAVTTISYLAGGKGVSFGQVATEEGFHSYMDSYFHKKIEGLYQIGDIFLSFNDRNPSLKFGGTWELVAKGKTLVGVDTSDTNFNTVKKTGGEKNHTLTIAEMPQHTHSYEYYIDKNPLGGYDKVIVYGNPQDTKYYVGNVANAGGSQSHNNLQPFITCYIWEKTA